MDALARPVTLVARWTALLGGLVLVILTLITVASISGRAMFTMANLGEAEGAISVLYPLMRSLGGFLVGLGAQPIPGDFELVEAGTAFAVFSFLPWCHLNRSHATVEILAGWFSNRVNLVIDVMADLLMLAMAVVIAWRHWLGTLDKISYGETTFILQFPIWWAYAASMFGASVFIIVAAFCLARSVRAMIAGLPAERSGAIH